VSMAGVRFVPVTGYGLTLQLAWSTHNTHPALHAFLETARRCSSLSDATRRSGGLAAELRE
jgi:hypothetical protein